MHRATPANSSFRAYVAGGARATVNTVDDNKQMQEHASDFMANESRSAIESPQNYGFTSVAMGAIQSLGGMGGGAGGGGAMSGIASQIVSCAETFIGFMGGNRSFPVAGNMDDRRHRLMGLAQGDSGMFSTLGRKLQSLMSKDGMFHTAPNDKTWRSALLSENSEQDQTSQTYQAQQRAQLPGGRAHTAALAALQAGTIKHIAQPLTDPIPGVPTLYDPGGTGGVTSGSNAFSSAGGQQRGQKSLQQKNQQASIFFDMTKDQTRAAGKVVQLIQAQSSGGGGQASTTNGGSGGGGQQQGTVLTELNNNQMYCGGSASKGKYALIVTLKGPTINVPGRIG